MATFIYNPDRKSKAQLIAEFVVRKKVFASIFKDLETGTMQQPEQHYLLVGQRGTGKTTLLTRLKYAVEDSSQLNNWLLPVMFAEEQYNITELANLWENIAQYLDDYAGFDNVYGEMEASLGKKDYEAICFDILAKHLDAQQKKIVLLIDNIGDLLKKFDELEVRRLREILQTKPHIRLIAASPFLLDSIIDYHQPLLEFFKVVRLEGLTKPETEELLLALGEVFDEKEKIANIIKEIPQRIEVMRTLSGGIPRTIALLFNVFVDDAHGTALTDLEKLLDAVTPLYKHRMDDLKPQQQKIMDAVARHWDAISVSELKKRVRMEGKIVSAQLHQLVQNQVLEKVPTKTKNNLYLLKERFFNIWYLMRYGRREGQQGVIWLVRLLESWCSPEDMVARIKDYTQKMKDGLLPEHYSTFYGQVYSAFKNITTDLKYDLKHAVPHNIAGQIEFSQQEVLSISDKLLKQEKYIEALEAFLDLYELSSETAKKIFFITIDAWAASFGTNTPKLLDHLSFFGKLDLSKKAHYEISLSYLSACTYVTIWTNYGQHEEVRKHIDLYIAYLNTFTDSSEINPFQTQIVSVILGLLMNKMYQTAQHFFDQVTTINMKEFIKPAYFATVYFTKGEDSVEYLKMGAEIKDFTDKLIKIVKENQDKLKA